MKLTVLLFVPWLLSCTKEEKKEPIPTPEPVSHDFSALDFGQAQTLETGTFVFAPDLHSMNVLKKGSMGPLSYTLAEVVQSDEKNTHLALETYSLIAPTALLIPNLEQNEETALFLDGNRLEYLFVENEYATVLATGEKINTPKHVSLTKEGVGASVFCKDKAYRLLLNKQKQRYLTLTFPSSLEVVAPQKCKILPLEPDLQIGQLVQVPLLGYYKKAKILKILRGAAEVQLIHANQKKIKQFPISQISTL